jgi:hypothetical protein
MLRLAYGLQAVVFLVVGGLFWSYFGGLGPRVRRPLRIMSSPLIAYGVFDGVMTGLMLQRGTEPGDDFFARTMLGIGVVAAIGAVPTAAWLVREILRQRRKGNSRPS